MLTPSESESLEELLASPGWDAYVKHVQEEWGPQGAKFQEQLDAALNLTDNNAAASQARQVRSGQKVILGIVRWPTERLAALRRNAQTEQFDERRPAMPMELLGHSRRGV